MKSSNTKVIPYFIVALIAAVALFFQNKHQTNSDPALENNVIRQVITPVEPNNQEETVISIQQDIESLTAEQTVVSYLKVNHHLPDYYITKEEARDRGWEPDQGNLCEALPGKAIGGDYFGNREGKLPKEKGRKYFEADINYNCGRRNAERLIYSNDGLIFISKNHYQTFEKIK